MWDVYTNYDTHVVKAKESAAEVARSFTWSNTADQFLDAFGDELTKPYVGSGEWVVAERKLYRIVTNADHSSHAAGIFRYFEKGREYWDLADIKRILFDACKLDVSCLEGDDLGLAPQQLDGLDEYKAQMAACPTCQQPLNTKIPQSVVHELDLTKKALEDAYATIRRMEGMPDPKPVTWNHIYTGVPQ
jgi:hypothetical protein